MGVGEDPGRTSSVTFKIVRSTDPPGTSVQLEDHEHRTDGGDNVGHGVDGDALHQDLILSSRM